MFVTLFLVVIDFETGESVRTSLGRRRRAGKSAEQIHSAQNDSCLGLMVNDLFRLGVNGPRSRRWPKPDI